MISITPGDLAPYGIVLTDTPEDKRRLHWAILAVESAIRGCVYAPDSPQHRATMLEAVALQVEAYQAAGITPGTASAASGGGAVSSQRLGSASITYTQDTGAAARASSLREGAAAPQVTRYLESQGYVPRVILRGGDW